MLENLFFDTKTHTYILTAPIKCFKCQKKMMGIGIIQSCFSKNKSFYRIYCQECQGKIKPDNLSIVKSILFARIVLRIKEHFIPIYLQPPELIDTRNSRTGLALGVWEASQTNNEGVKIVDKAIISRNPNCNIQLDAKNKDDIRISLENKNKSLLIDEADDYLKTLAFAEPLIESKEKKLIENV